MHEVSRRAALSGGLGLLGLAVVGIDQSAAEAATSGPVRKDYATSVGKVFTLQNASGSVSATLASLLDLPFATAANSQYCFSLLFTPAKNVALPDGIYTVKRSGVPTYSLFLGRVGTGSSLQAVVNRAY